MARGDASALVHQALAGREVPVDGFVLCTQRSGPGRALPSAPTLLVTGKPSSGGSRPDLARGYAPALHGSCVRCHEEQAAKVGRPDLAECRTCHGDGMEREGGAPR